jgi:hypothetical protein
MVDYKRQGVTMCPYLKNGNVCNFFDTYQEGYNWKTYCLTDKWTGCENFTRRSEEERRKKLV